MKTYILTGYAVICMLLLVSCSKSEFLDAKPITAVGTLKTLQDYQNLLENINVINKSGSLGQLASDDYQLSYESWQTLSSTERNSYIWERDIFEGQQDIDDWNGPYKIVFYANNVLEGLAASDSSMSTQGKQIRGWALFVRSFAFYDLCSQFCKPHDERTAGTDPGIPIRLSAGIDKTVGRSSVGDSYVRILSDLREAVQLLPEQRPAGNLNRPWKGAAYALLARVMLNMRDYGGAELYADSALGMHSSLIDYNGLSTTSATPFNSTHAELIYNASAFGSYTLATSSANNPARITPELISLYGAADLRLSLYFTLNKDGSYSKKRGYYGTGLYPFTGLATDELFLIKAECLARRGERAAALAELNKLLVKRYSNKVTFVPLQPASEAETLALVLRERRKELVFRCQRWQDLRRLNQEGAGIRLSRTLNGQVYELEPGSSRYVFPIPDEEIVLTGIEQNVR